MAEDSLIDKRRVMKNSLSLFKRTLFTLVVGLYNSRVVLEVLGVDDFGVYSLVGSLVTIFIFFTSTISSSMSRFFAYEYASGDKERLRDTFGTAMVIVMMIVVFIVTIAESFGGYMISQLSIPQEARGAAYIVYQYTVVTVSLQIIQTCYISAIIAREDMGVFAYIDIAQSTLKLGAIFILKFVPGNKLELYAFLVMVSVLCVTIYAIAYCRRKFPECRVWFRFRKSIFKPLLSYTGWNLYKTVCEALRPTGFNVVVNLYFGVAVNAAVGIALNVGSNIAKFTANVFMAFKPQIVKAYAIEAYDKMTELLSDAIKFSMLALMLVDIALIVEMPYVLKLWLGECPAYAAIFCRLICISMFFELTISILEFGINATGSIRAFCIINGSMVIATVVAGAIAYHFGAPAPAIYVAQIATGITCIIFDSILLKRLIPYISVGNLYKLMAKLLCSGIVVALACIAAHQLRLPAFMRLLTVGLTGVFVTGIIAWIFFLPQNIKSKIVGKLSLRS